MTVRDCAPFLPKVLKNVTRLRSLFQDFVLIVAYDHCQDESESILRRYQRYSTFPVYLLQGDTTSPHRTVRIADARNRCLEKVEELDMVFHFMVDADNVNCEPWNLTLLKYYVSNTEWDALSFNRPGYYDIWALMYPPFQHHCWGFYNNSREVVEFMRKDIVKQLETCDHFFPCQSAFNGFAMYRTSVFKHKRYSGKYQELKPYISDSARKETLHALSSIKDIQLDESFVESCEHLYYHLSVPHARILISKYIL